MDARLGGWRAEVLLERSDLAATAAVSHAFRECKTF